MMITNSTSQCATTGPQSATVTTSETDIMTMTAAAALESPTTKRRVSLYEEDEQPAAKRQRTVTKKRVRFSDDSETHVVSRVQDQDAYHVWWSVEDFHYSRQCDNHWINFYSFCDDSYRQLLFPVVGSACGKLPSCPTNHAHALAAHDCRGLEREMTPCFRQRKKQVVTNVLQSQKALQKWRMDGNIDKINKGADILASHYQRLAQPAARFAQLLAQGDAQVVATMQ